MKKTSTKPATETQPSKLEVNKSIKVIRILFRGTCPKMTARGKGDLSYEIGIDENSSESYVRISGNVISSLPHILTLNSSSFLFD